MNGATTRGDSAPLLMLQPREVSWWAWLASAALLLFWVAGRAEAFWALGALSLAQVAYFRLREGRFGAFPVQVRVAYAGVVAVAALDPTHLFVWAPTIGTLAQVTVGYCLLARTMALMPWNRREPFTGSLLWRTYTAPPRRGSVLQGQPPLREAGAR